MDNKQHNCISFPRELFIFAQWLWSALNQPCLFSNTVGGGPGGRSLNAKNRKANIESDTVPPWEGVLVSHMSPFRWGALLTAAESQGSKSRQVDISGQDYLLSSAGSEGWCRAELKGLSNSISLTTDTLNHIINYTFPLKFPFQSIFCHTDAHEFRCSWKCSGFGQKPRCPECISESPSMYPTCPVVYTWGKLFPKSFISICE